MYRIGLLAVDQCIASSLFGVMDALHIANLAIENHLQSNQYRFEWQYLSMSGESVTASGGPRIHADECIKQAKELNLIYVPGVYYESKESFQAWLDFHKPVQTWLRDQWQAGTKVAANCSGSFLLAEAGILEQSEAATSWWLENQFRKKYPGHKLVSQKLVTYSNNIYCAGSMTSYLNLVIDIVAREISTKVADHVSRYMSIRNREASQFQTPYHYLEENVTQKDAQVSKAQYWILNNLHKKIDLNFLSQFLGVSQKTLSRRFKETINMTPAAYIQSARINAAQLLLKGSSLPISEIIEQVGYNSPGAFNETFKKVSGKTPSEYRQSHLEFD